MKADIDCNYIPDTHWTQWRNQEDFSFLQSHLVWEHPAVSRLAKLTRPTYWEFDADADIILRDFITQYWVPDILSRKEEIHEELYDKALEMNIVSTFEVLDHPEVISMFVEMRQVEGKQYDNFENDSIHAEIKKIPTERLQEIDFTFVVKDPYIKRLVQEILILIIIHGYEPLKENINEYLREEYKNGDEEDKTIYDLYLSVENEQEDYGYYNALTPVEYKKIYNENVYWLMIMLYPSENLPSYIHDQMAFMNYIQEIVEHNSLQEKEIVKNNTLNNDMNISLEDYKFGVCRISSYWT